MGQSRTCVVWLTLSQLILLIASASPARAADVWQAAAAGDVAELKARLAGGVDVNSADEERGWTPLIFAASAGKVDAVKALLAARADVNFASESKSETALQMAAAGGHVDVIKLLIGKGAGVDEYQSPSHAPIAYAAENKQLAAMRALLDLGASATVSDEYDNEPVVYAAMGGSVDAIKLLTARGAKLLARSSTTELTALSGAASGGHAEVVRYLLDNGADPSENNRNRSALGFAAEHGHSEVVLLLLDRGAKLNMELQNEPSLFPYFAARGDVKMMRELLRRGAKVDHQWTGLEEAALGGHRDAVQFILDQKGWFTFESRYDEVCEKLIKKPDVDMFYLVRNGRRQRTETLPDASVQEQERKLLAAAVAGDATAAGAVAEAARVSDDGVVSAALAIAENEGHLDVARALRPLADRVAARAKQAEKFASDMRSAASRGDVAKMRKLVADGADPLFCDLDSGASLMFAAAGSGKPEAVQFLIDRGVKPDHMGKTGYLRDQTPLRNAASNNHTDVLKLLIASGADVNATDSNGFSPLLLAASHGNAESVKALLAAKADVNRPGPGKSGALAMAAEKGHSEVIKLLLAAGADANAKNWQGATPLSIAQANGRAEAAAALAQAGATKGAPARVDLMQLLNGPPDAVKGWLDRGGDPNAEVAGLHMPLLSYVIESGTDDVRRLALVRMLTDRGANVRGAGALTQAVYYKRSVELLKVLIDKGADVNEVGFGDGTTPLIMAVTNGDAAVVKLLVGAGADPRKARKDRETPLSLARKLRGGLPIVQVLQAAPALKNAPTSKPAAPAAKGGGPR